MIKFYNTCPYCRQKVYFKTQGCVLQKNNVVTHIKQDGLHLTVNCLSCGSSALAITHDNYLIKTSLASINGQVTEQTIAECLHRLIRSDTETMIQVIHLYPVPPKTITSEHYPDEINELFEEVQELFKTKRLPQTILNSCKSLLEAALKKLDVGKKKQKLQYRTDEAFDKRLITEDLKDWAHHLRVDANVGNHENKGERAWLKEYIAFLGIFLELTFAIPAKIKLKKKENTTKDNDSSPDSDDSLPTDQIPFTDD